MLADLTGCLKMVGQRSVAYQLTSAQDTVSIAQVRLVASARVWQMNYVFQNWTCERSTEHQREQRDNESQALVEGVADCHQETARAPANGFADGMLPWVYGRVPQVQRRAPA